MTRETLPEGDFVLFALDPQHYQNQTLNDAEVTRWVQEAMWRLQYYRGDQDVPEKD